jgi:histidyl-tRNA synthetase
MERLILNLKRQQVAIPQLPNPKVWIAQQVEKAGEAALKLAQKMRLARIPVIEAPANKSLKAQLRQASAMGAVQVIILGEAELANGTVTLRDMTKAEQKSITQEELMTLLTSFTIG